MKKRWGGRRLGAGRKPAAAGKRTVAHRSREKFDELLPLHVTVKLVKGMPTLRSPAMAKVLEQAFVGGRERFGFRLVHYSAMSNHLHFIVEADNSVALARGMKGLLVRIARNLNRAVNRTGRVFAERYHSTVLRTTVQVKNALQYVLCNARRHGVALTTTLDPFSSAEWFDGWAGIEEVPTRPSPMAEPRSWQLRSGWHLHGRLSPYRIPGPRMD